MISVATERKSGRKMQNNPEKKINIWFFAGLVLTLVSAALFLILKGDSIFINHDQMDGEMLCYILNAKHLFDGNSIPEFMNGMAKTSLTPPAPLFVLLFRILSPLYAFITMRYIVMFVAYVGMYLLLMKKNIRPWISALVALIFAYAPFIHVYGFSMYGAPMLAWAYISIEEGKKKFSHLCIIILITLGSSLVLSGFALLLFAGIHLVVLLVKKEKNKAINTLIASLVMGITYLLCNVDFVAQVLGIGEKAYETHKNEASIASSNFLDTFANSLLDGIAHSGFNRIPILVFAVLVSLVCFFNRKFYREKIKEVRWIFICLIMIALFEAIYESAPLVNFRETIGGPAAWFQLSRFDWIAPAMVLVMLADAMEITASWLSDKELFSTKIISLFMTGLGLLACFATTLIFLWNDTWKDNVKVLMGKDSQLLSWNEYYAIDVYEQVEDYIYNATGRSREEYKVVSLGICPAAALYNGFNCLDGYSNNYDVEYKHEFRRIIAPELEKNDYIKAYFDEWGNRCYLLSAQTPGYFTIEKGGFYFDNYEIDTDALKDMGGQYLFSAAYIMNAEEQGLTLLNETPIETSASYYRVYIYRVD